MMIIMKKGDFDKLERALGNGSSVVLEKGKNGEILLGRIFNNLSDLEGSKYFPDKVEKVKLLPDFVLVKNFIEER